MINQIHALYFSPTNSTATVCQTIARELERELDRELIMRDLTIPEFRDKPLALAHDDLLIFGVPVYGGRIPELIEPVIMELRGAATPAIIVTVYGNRDYEDALLELKDRLHSSGFQVIAAAAFIGEHSYSHLIAAGRPDADDRRIATDFALAAAQKIPDALAHQVDDLFIKGNHPYKERQPARNFAPKTSPDCFYCELCASLCPVGAIAALDPYQVDADSCIKCCSCVKSCPVEAKYFDEELLRQVINYLEENCMVRREPELFL